MRSMLEALTHALETMRRQRKDDDRGMALIELVVASVIGTILIGSAVTFTLLAFRGQTQSNAHTQAESEAQTSVNSIVNSVQDANAVLTAQPSTVVVQQSTGTRAAPVYKLIGYSVQPDPSNSSILNMYRVIQTQSTPFGANPTLQWTNGSKVGSKLVTTSTLFTYYDGTGAVTTTASSVARVGIKYVATNTVGTSTIITTAYIHNTSGGGVPYPQAMSDVVTVHAGSSANVAVLNNDTCGGGVSPCLKSSLTNETVTADPNQPTILGVVNADGTVNVAVPVGATVGTVAYLSYTITDAYGTSTNTIQVTVQPPLVPSAQPDTASQFPSDPVVVSVLANDTCNAGATPCPKASLTSETTGSPSIPADITSVVVNASGTITVRIAPGATPGDVVTIPYTITDASGSSTASITVTVLNPPIPANASATGVGTQDIGGVTQAAATETAGKAGVSYPAVKYATSYKIYEMSSQADSTLGTPVATVAGAHPLTSAPLIVSTTEPAGSRVFFVVVACNVSGCSPNSADANSSQRVTTDGSGNAINVAYQRPGDPGVTATVPTLTDNTETVSTNENADGGESAANQFCGLAGNPGGCAYNMTMSRTDGNGTAPAGAGWLYGQPASTNRTFAGSNAGSSGDWGATDTTQTTSCNIGGCSTSATFQMRHYPGPFGWAGSSNVSAELDSHGSSSNGGSGATFDDSCNGSTTCTGAGQLARATTVFYGSGGSTASYTWGIRSIADTASVAAGVPVASGTVSGTNTWNATNSVPAVTLDPGAVYSVNVTSTAPNGLQRTVGPDDIQVPPTAVALTEETSSCNSKYTNGSSGVAGGNKFWKPVYRFSVNGGVFQRGSSYYYGYADTVHITSLVAHVKSTHLTGSFLQGVVDSADASGLPKGVQSTAVWQGLAVRSGLTYPGGSLNVSDDANSDTYENQYSLGTPSNFTPGQILGIAVVPPNSGNSGASMYANGNNPSTIIPMGNTASKSGDFSDLWTIPDTIGAVGAMRDYQIVNQAGAHDPSSNTFAYGTWTGNTDFKWSGQSLAMTCQSAGAGNDATIDMGGGTTVYDRAQNMARGGKSNIPGDVDISNNKWWAGGTLAFNTLDGHHQ